MNKNKDKIKKKAIVMTIIGIAFMLILIITSTYAYFMVNATNKTSETIITGKTEKVGNATLSTLISNLHLDVNAIDMSKENLGNYYATDVEGKSYEENDKEGTKSIAQVEFNGGEDTTIYSCTAKLTISKVTDGSNKDTMIDVINSGDIILQFKGNIISEQLDLSELKENNQKEYNLNFKIIGNNQKKIKAYIKLINKNDNQNYLEGKNLNINISTSELNCKITSLDSKIAQLRTKDTNKSLSPDLQGGMYRYQGTDNVNNWICFGTRDNCDFTNEEYVDKYAYRIIGITQEGEMYLIKETFIKEKTVTEFAWDDFYLIDGPDGDLCPNGLCPEWNESDLFQRINGTANGTIPGKGDNNDGVDDNTDIFVDSNEYEYLKSGDTYNGETASEWYNLISNHEWMYGDAVDAYYNGNQMYEIETGNKFARHYIYQYKGSTTVVEEQYKWPETNSVNAKISLMYLNDVVYAYYDGSNSDTRGKPNNAANSKNSWIHFQKDGYNTSSNNNWLSTRWGIGSTISKIVHAYYLNSDGSMYAHWLSVGRGVRPVFYLKSEVTIKDGVGTKNKPFILG